MKNNEQQIGVLKGDYPHPMVNMDKEHFVKYADAIMNMNEDEYNSNSCEQEREFENPYATYKLVGSHDLWGTHAEVRVLKCKQNPDTFLSDEKALLVKTLLKSESTNDEWKFGTMEWFDIAKLIVEGKLVETQRDVEWSVYEFKGVLQKCISEAKVSPKKAYYMVSSQLFELCDTAQRNNLNFDEVREVAIMSTNEKKDGKELIQKLVKDKGEEYIAWKYTSKDETINRLLEDVSEMFCGSSTDEVGFMLTFVARVLDKVKREQVESSQDEKEFRARTKATGVIEIMFALMEETKSLDNKVEEFMTITKGGINGKDIPKA
tara:strand:- start:1162 stop:2121 length:960 start_codon:yes stop_codon:yes gene_type:complete